MPTLTPSSPDSPPIDPEAVRTVHLMAIAGTGMGAFARLLQEAGYQVRGSDEKVWPPMSDLLRAAGIRWMEGFRPENLEPPPDLVIVGNVIRRVNPEAQAMRDRHLPHLSFPEALGALFLEGRHSVVVAGTHGKTTTSTLVAWLLHHNRRDPSFLVGGVGQNLGDSARLGGGPHFVVEGDEYDTAYFDKGPKLLHYRPRSAILTSIELDHADIYRDLAHYVSAFERFVALLPEDGFLAAWAGSDRVLAVARRCPGTVETYAARDGVDADWTAGDLVLGADGARFRLVHRGEDLGEMHLPLGGRHNVENALGAAAVATRLGLTPEEIAAGLATFEGVRRRQEIRGEPDGVTVIDDFAHHPTAVAETVQAIRSRYPGRRLWAVFEPRSNTARRNLYQARYAEAFDGADQVVISAPPPHPDPIPEAERFDPPGLAEALRARGLEARHLAGPEAILEALVAETNPGDVVLLMSNGAFGGLPARLVEALAAR